VDPPFRRGSRGDPWRDRRLGRDALRCDQRRSAAAIFYLRWGSGPFANVRPLRWRPGYASPLARPDGIDLVIVRENLEDLYAGVEGELSALRPLGLASRIGGGLVAELGPGASR